MADRTPEGNGEDTKRLALGSLMESFDKTLSPAEAMLAAFNAASQLSPHSPEGEAAIDRVMDIAGRNTRAEPQAANMLREAARMARPRSTLAEKGLDLYMNYIQGLRDPGARASAALFVSWSVKNPPVETEKRFIQIWHDVMGGLIRAGEPGQAARSLSTVITSPLTKGILRRESNILWPILIDATEYKSGYMAAIQQAKTDSGQIYELSLRPSDYAEIKEIIAGKLLELALKADPEPGFQATMEAAKYDGQNIALHARIAKRLYDIAGITSIQARRNEALSMAEDHIACLRLPHQRPDTSPSPSP